MTQSDAIDHDGLFKELIQTFFWEFLELFLPQVLEYVERGTVRFLSQEVYSSIADQEKRVIDLLAQVKFRGQDSYFLFHIEPQSSSQSKFEKRMFRYFGRLHEQHDLPIYPVVIFSYDRPLKEAESSYSVEFPDFKVLEFNFRVIQLNRLSWRDYIKHPNPVASALMAKMQIAQTERPRVKVACLRMLATLQLDPARTEFLSRFIDAYLRLSVSEDEVFRAEIDRLETAEKETIMQTMTSWEEKGFKKGLEREVGLVMRLLNRKIGQLPPGIDAQIKALEIEEVEALGEALLEFEGTSDLTAWLGNLSAS